MLARQARLTHILRYSPDIARRGLDAVPPLAIHVVNWNLGGPDTCCREWILHIQYIKNRIIVGYLHIFALTIAMRYIILMT